MANGTVQRMGMQTWRLWENSDPTVAFTAKTISGDLSAYDAFLIEYGGSTTYYNNIMSEIVLKNGKQYMLSCILASGNTPRNRGVTATDSGITFSGGYQSGSANNNAVIPLVIHGIKGIPLS